MATTPDTHKCTLCSKNRKGRFTRRTSAGPGEFPKGGKGHDIPNWYCFTCLPEGSGRGELPSKDEVVERPRFTPDAAAIDVGKEHERGLAMATPLLLQLPTKITTEAEFLAADELLGQFRNVRRGWGAIWSIIQDRVIKKQREALDGIYSVNRDVDGPMEKGEMALKSLMKSYKDEEARTLAAAETKRIADAEALQREIDAAEAKKQAAPTPQLRGRIAAQQVKLEEKQMAVITQVNVAVLGSHSSTRTITYPVVGNLPQLALALLGGSLKGETEVRDKVLEAVNAVLRAEGRTNERKAEMVTWPGVVLHSESQIAGR